MLDYFICRMFSTMTDEEINKYCDDHRRLTVSYKMLLERDREAYLASLKKDLHD